MRPLGLHMAMRKASGWVNPYITDGLVAMWDGEWNAGGGKHDANATEWANLVDSNNNLRYKYSADTPIWGDNCVIGDGVNRTLTADNPVLGLNAMSVEVVLGKSTASGNSWAVMARDRASSDFGWWQYATSTSSCTMTFSSAYFTAAAVEDAGTLSYCAEFFPGEERTTGNTFANGALLKNLTFRNQSTNNMVLGIGQPEITMGGALPWNVNCPFKGTLYNVRLYSRALTAEEVAHNYAIDQERFGL